MELKLKIKTASDYFEHQGREVDDDETGDTNLVSLDEYNSVGDIIACEVAIWALRRLTHSCGSNSDAMAGIRFVLIVAHNMKYPEYECLQDYN